MTTNVTSLDQPFWFYCKIKSSLAKKHQNFPDSKVPRLKVSTLHSGFKISGDMAKLGSFNFGFVQLCVNGKTNPVLKRSGFVTNPELFRWCKPSVRGIYSEPLPFSMLSNNWYHIVKRNLISLNYLSKFYSYFVRFNMVRIKDISKIQLWSINAAFWLFELLPGYLL